LTPNPELENRLDAISEKAKPMKPTGRSTASVSGSVNLLHMAALSKLAWTLIAAAGLLAANEIIQDPPAYARDSALEGMAAYGDWRSDTPGIRRYIREQDLPGPYASPSSAKFAAVVEKPANARLMVPAGFAIKLFASGLDRPRLLRVAPNGDIFVAESWAGRIRVLRPADNGAAVSRNEIFAEGFNLPFGIALYPNGDNPQWVYVANTDSVVRFPYRLGDLQAQEKPQIIVPKLPAGGGHWTRDITFSRDGTKMFVSVGSASNAAEGTDPLDLASPGQWIAILRQRVRSALYGSNLRDETERAAVLVFDPEGKSRRIFASGVRNCSGMALNPENSDLWCSTNERDGLGDDLPPDYITRVREGSFYGWPWYYIGPHEDPRHQGARPDLKDRITVPDILIQPHSAPLQMMFYTARQFPEEYQGNIFAAVHGSWNRSKLVGFKIIRGIMRSGVPTGSYEDFVTGFVINDEQVWGRPAGVAQAIDGSLLFSEDGNGTIWRISWTGAVSIQ
jgi:glucose/arabinose dehydrogenase